MQTERRKTKLDMGVVKMNKNESVTSILVVDGSSASRKLVANKLKHARPEIMIDTRATVSSAMPKLRERSYDLVTVGFTLPDGNGLDLAARIRSLEPNAETPIVMISSNASADTQIRVAHGINAHFDKSLGIDALIEYLESFLPKPIEPPPRVLFVEDSKTVRKVICRFFEKNDIPFSAVDSGDEAKILINTLQDQLDSEFDIVITDMNLDGDVSGEDLVRYIRKDLGINKKALPILLATGSDSEELDFAHLRKLGVNDFINKPVEQEVLLARMEPWVFIKQNLH